MPSALPSHKTFHSHLSPFCLSNAAATVWKNRSEKLPYSQYFPQSFGF
ncbi:hypothetical protein E2C01_076398 [Portunus trituberculatus]|uniref:Uncharacterized protein n=1 Tax=Portunus trituberculatus TaxID=210409 RepID=A0A5B7IHQ0_PORTR|nr:hypothetical protein [Portunus trituberculatus]